MEEGGSGLVGCARKWSRAAKSFGLALAEGSAQSCGFCAWKSLGSFPWSGTMSASEVEVVCQPGSTGRIRNMLRMRRRLL